MKKKLKEQKEDKNFGSWEELRFNPFSLNLLVWLLLVALIKYIIWG